MSARGAWLLVVLSAAAAHAQPGRENQALTRPENWGLTFGLEAITTTFEPRGAMPYDFDTRGTGISLNIGVNFLRYWLAGLEGGTLFFKGDQTFVLGGEHHRAQTTNSLVGTLYTGVTTAPMGRSPQLGRKWWAGFLVGSSHWTGERRLRNCAPCFADRIGMRAAFFAEPFVMFGGGDRDGGGGFRLAYRRYLRDVDTVTGAIHFGLFFNFLKL